MARGVESWRGRGHRGGDAARGAPDPLRLPAPVPLFSLHVEFPGAARSPPPEQGEANGQEGAGQNAIVRRVKGEPGDGGRPDPIPFAPATGPPLEGRCSSCRQPEIMIATGMFRIYLLFCLVFALLISSVAEKHVEESHQANIRLDKNLVQDKDHIMEHLEGVIDKPESEMSPQELQLHYFKMHDYDGNNLLDGLELATAISHVHKEEGGEHSQAMKEEELISLIDDVLRDDDKNNDGYIDYAEFAKSLE